MTGTPKITEAVALAAHARIVAVLAGAGVADHPQVAADLRALLDAVKAQSEPPAEEWEYAQSEVLEDGTTAFGMAVPTLEEALRRRDTDRMGYPWPEEIGVGRRRKAGPWEPVAPKKGQD